MEDLISEVVSLVAALGALLSVWFARKASRGTPRGQRKAELAARAVRTARAHPSKGVPLETTALEYAILLDMEDGKADFKREELWAEVRSVIAGEKK